MDVKVRPSEVDVPSAGPRTGAGIMALVWPGVMAPSTLRTSAGLNIVLGFSGRVKAPSTRLGAFDQCAAMTERFAGDAACMDFDPVHVNPDQDHVGIGETGREELVRAGWP